MGSWGTQVSPSGRMASPTAWSTRSPPRTPLVLALAIATVTATLCVRTSHAQQLFQGMEQIAETWAQIWPEFRPDIEAHTKKMKDNSVTQMRALMDNIIHKISAQCYCKNITESQSRQVAIDLVPRRRPDNIESILIMHNSQHENDNSHWSTSMAEFLRPYEDAGRDS